MIPFKSIFDASGRIKKHALQTPLLALAHNPDSFSLLAKPSNLFLKAENLQRTGSFKFRGAFNQLSILANLNADVRVVACSSGNHGQGVGAAAQILGIPATIIMPSDAPLVKLQRTAATGARIIQYDREHEDREAIAASLCESSGAQLVHPFENEGVISGQGTIGLEIATQLIDEGLKPEQIVICCGGGGLAGGIISALNPTFPNCRFVLVEPDSFDDYGRSLRSGRRESNPKMTGSICDSLLTNSPGKRSFAICNAVLARSAGSSSFVNINGGHGNNNNINSSSRRGVMDSSQHDTNIITAVSVSDAEVKHAMRWAFSYMRLVLEPGGAVALAAALAGKIPDLDSLTTVVLASGGNADPALFAEVISQS